MTEPKNYTGWEIYKRLLGFTKKYKSVFIVGVVANILFALVETYFVNSIKYLIDDGIKARDSYFLLVKTPLFIMGAIMLRGVFNFVSVYCMGWVGRKVVDRKSVV